MQYTKKHTAAEAAHSLPAFYYLDQTIRSNVSSFVSFSFFTNVGCSCQSFRL